MSDPMREAHFAQQTMELLQRVQLQGAEVPAFVAVHNWLQSKVELAQKAQSADNVMSTVTRMNKQAAKAAKAARDVSEIPASEIVDGDPDDAA